MITAREEFVDQNGDIASGAIGGLIKYLSDINRYPMKEYLSEVDKYPILSEAEEQMLAEQVYDGNDEIALEKLVLSNLRLVAKIALECCDEIPLFDPADDQITALYKWSTGAPAPVKALSYRRALPAVAGA
jgi:hypothetical protein